ncbi:MAG: hypothetical protein J0H65_09335 [Rhizobiales bacterium]|nr:hypothetical protein [Hyphomicrobiales bacterium]
MRKQAFCYFVLGASLSMLLHNLALRRALAPPRPARRSQAAEVIDLAAWRHSRSNAQ